MIKKTLFAIVIAWATSVWGWVWNNPYPYAEVNQRILYGAFAESPKTLDPAIAYNVNESLFIEQVDEPLLEYDYFRRPYQLVPLVASSMPVVRYYRTNGTEIHDPNVESVAYSVYTIAIQPHVHYQTHPAFAKRADGSYRYLALQEDALRKMHIQTLADFKEHGTRELVVDDFIYAMKRLADPHVNSPIYGLMRFYITGFEELNQQLSALPSSAWIDLRSFPLRGVKKLDDYHFEIRINGHYPSFLYWLAMHFFSPVPWEADQFYAQPGMAAHNIGFAWNPLGTGPFMLTENNPNRRMVLERNPHYRTVRFPSSDNKTDQRAGYTKHAGEVIPLIDKAVYTLEKESIPRWNKFLQGYYDVSLLTADGFDQAIRLNQFGFDELTLEMKRKKMQLVESIEPAIYYWGFNMLDPLVGGSSERARLLRLAISLAVNTEEQIALFYNGRGRPAHGPLPPEIFGYQMAPSQLNRWLYVKRNGHIMRRSLKDAKQWLRLAGYPNGIDPTTHKPLMIHYDVATSNAPDERSQLEWMRKRLHKIGLSLSVLPTHYNRFQEKMRTGNIQLFTWGWRADYPDPENFLFLLYGPNGKVRYGGENATNYANPVFDQLFHAIKNRTNDATRAQLIAQIIQVAQHDAPWIWGFYSKTLMLRHQWISPLKPNTMMLNTLKYVSVDVPLRNRMREQWNQAILWPVGSVMVIIGVFLMPLWGVYQRRERRMAQRFQE